MSIFIVPFFLVPTESTSQGKILYKLEEGRMSRTDDSGKSWRLLETAPKNITLIACSDERPDRIIIAAKGGIQLSTNGGRAWMWTMPPSLEFTPIKIAISSQNPNVIWLAGALKNPGGRVYTEIFRSLNGGFVWTHVETSPEPIDNLHMDPDTPSKFWFGTPNVQSRERGQ